MPSFDIQHAETALSAYLNLLKSKGATTGVVTRRKHFLRHLITALEVEASGAAADDAGYRQAVDTTVSRFPDEQQIEIISTAREFHPFWIGDLKTIARLNAANALSLDHAPVNVQGGLVEMFDQLNNDPWLHEEHACLEQYLIRLTQAGADAAVVDIRERLLLLLLYIIRHAEPTPTAYRSGVDAMLTLFNREEPKRVFLEVAREFFYFWNGFHGGQAITLAHAA